MNEADRSVKVIKGLEARYMKCVRGEEIEDNLSRASRELSAPIEAIDNAIKEYRKRKSGYWSQWKDVQV